MPYTRQVKTSNGIRFPGVAVSIKIACPECGTSALAAEDLAGRPVKCPTCKCTFVLTDRKVSLSLPVAASSPSSAEQRWFVARKGQRFGPFSWKQVKELADAGMIKPTTMLLRGDGMADWVEAQS